ncbi:ribonuclease HII [Parenemella sanctibonifatiensis]|uniref:Ribonuclease HII n=1 Tax=Parenemella sanctibonifatiensis TaxID=2016505 RepID=A0A255EEJ7_9ACTN|nr:ribonuclease HII [Parenemella sanctibonifatiensis]OYN89967.1 ribonuclease HII [Parenemella sanctibonifatiensis]
MGPLPAAAGRQRFVVRRGSAYGYERALHRAGLGPVAGADEAGRGACAGPLVAAAAILDPKRPIAGLDDSKKLTAATRERLHDEIQERALAWSLVRIEADECDQLGMHEANLAALRRAVNRLEITPEFALTDGFEVPGLGCPSLAVWKGDQVAACVSAASILAKVTRDRIMTQMAAELPAYGFEIHKGYNTALHQERLAAHGPSAQHRMRYRNVREAARKHGVAVPAALRDPEPADEG